MKVKKEVYEAVMELYGYRCAECGTSTDVQLHHKLPKSKWRQKKYPLLIHSPINLVPLCGGMGNGCHEKYKHKYKIGDRKAVVYEEYLRSIMCSANNECLKMVNLLKDVKNNKGEKHEKGI